MEWYEQDNTLSLKQWMDLQDNGTGSRKLDAAYMIGVCYALGEGGAEEDIFEAVRYFKKAAKERHCLAMLVLGQCYYGGFGVDKDENIALRLIQEAADTRLFEAVEWITDYKMYNRDDGYYKPAELNIYRIK